MSDFEMLNQRTLAQKAVKRKEAIKGWAKLGVIVLAVVMAFVGLEYIGFISELFMLILVFGTALVGAFHAGRISNNFKR